MKRWTDEEITILTELWPTNSPVSHIARKLGRTQSAVNIKASHLKLPKREDPNKITLSRSDLYWLKTNYPHIRTELCAMKLGISLRSCVRIARQLGVAKTPQFIRECQIFAASKAKESHLRNGTYPQKGVVNPNLEKGEAHRFRSKPATLANPPKMSEAPAGLSKVNNNPTTPKNLSK